VPVLAPVPVLDRVTAKRNHGDNIFYTGGHGSNFPKRGVRRPYVWIRFCSSSRCRLRHRNDGKLCRMELFQQPQPGRLRRMPLRGCAGPAPREKSEPPEFTRDLLVYCYILV